MRSHALSLRRFWPAWAYVDIPARPGALYTHHTRPLCLCTLFVTFCHGLKAVYLLDLPCGNARCSACPQSSRSLPSQQLRCTHSARCAHPPPTPRAALLQVLGILGKGSFGQVLKCHDFRTNTLRAVKVIRNKKRFHHQVFAPFLQARLGGWAAAATSTAVCTVVLRRAPLCWREARHAPGTH